MVKENFDKLITALDLRINNCKHNLSAIKTTVDLELLTIAQARDLKAFCIKELDTMTKILMVDLYHIIGMGDLTPIQMMKFIYKIKQYAEFRPDVKAIASQLNSIEVLPKIPTKTKFKLLALCDLTLYSGTGEETEEIAFLDEYKQVLNPLYSLKGNTITVRLDKLDEFIKILEVLTKTEAKQDAMQKAIDSNKDYFGISWISKTDTIATGICKNECLLKKL